MPPSTQTPPPQSRPDPETQFQPRSTQRQQVAALASLLCWPQQGNPLQQSLMPNPLAYQYSNTLDSWAEEQPQWALTGEAQWDTLVVVSQPSLAVDPRFFLMMVAQVFLKVDPRFPR